MCLHPLSKTKRCGGDLLVSGGMNSNPYAVDNTVKSPCFRALRQKDCMVFAVMHSSQPKFTLQDIVEDLPRVIRCTRFHSKRFGLDSKRIGVTGKSSGG